MSRGVSPKNTLFLIVGSYELNIVANIDRIGTAFMFFRLKEMSFCGIILLNVVISIIIAGGSVHDRYGKENGCERICG